MSQIDLIDLLKQYGNYPVQEEAQTPDYLKNPFMNLSSYVWNNSIGGMLTGVISDLLKELDGDEHRGIFNLK